MTKMTEADPSLLTIIAMLQNVCGLLQRTCSALERHRFDDTTEGQCARLTDAGDVLQLGERGIASVCRDFRDANAPNDAPNTQAQARPAPRARKKPSPSRNPPT